MIIRAFLAVLFLALPAHAGEVRFTNAPGSWTGYDEHGTVLPLSGTDCDKFAASLSYAWSHGHDFRHEGGGLTPAGADPSTLICNRQIILPPLQKFSWTAGAVTINFTNNVTGAGIVIDSCMMCRFYWGGQVVHQGGHPTVSFFPRTQLPLDPVTAIVDSRFVFHSLAGIDTQGNETLLWNTTLAGIDNSTFMVDEINADKMYHGARLISGGYSFTGNRVIFPHVHSAQNVSVAIGTSPTNNIFGNYFDVNINPANGGHGFLTYGHGDEWHVSVNGAGSVGAWVILEAGAVDNAIFRRRIQGTVTDNSGGTNRFF